MVAPSGSGRTHHLLPETQSETAVRVRDCRQTGALRHDGVLVHAIIEQESPETADRLIQALFNLKRHYLWNTIELFSGKPNAAAAVA